MSPETAFALGFGTAFVAVFVVAKVMKPQIVSTASRIASNSLYRFAQQNGLSMAQFIDQRVIEAQLITPAINDALSQVWI